MTKLNKQEERASKKLKAHKLTLDELSVYLGSTTEETLKVIESLEANNIPVDLTKAHRGRKQLYHINVFPAAGNVYTIRVWKFAATSDWHMASIFHMSKTWHEAMKITEDKGIKRVYVAGDLVDGVGIYPGHLENLMVTSIEKQTDLVAEAVSKHPDLEFWGISGNHDYSFTKQNGAKPLSILEAKVDNFKNLGDVSADFIQRGIRIRMLHGAGGRAYATSYPSQTYLRDYFKGMEREEFLTAPHVMIVGHYHTLYQSKDHGIWILQTGSFQDPDNEFCKRRGLTGPNGLYHVEIHFRNGEINSFKTEYIQPSARRKEKGSIFAKTSRNYRR